jgi:hypothetical protein
MLLKHRVLCFAILLYIFCSCICLTCAIPIGWCTNKNYYYYYYYYYLKTLWGDRHFGRILQNKIIEKIKACVPNFFDNECKNHKLFLVNFLVKVLVFKECKSYTNALKGLKVKSYKSQRRFQFSNMIKIF